MADANRDGEEERMKMDCVQMTWSQNSYRGVDVWLVSNIQIVVTFLVNQELIDYGNA